MRRWPDTLPTPSTPGFSLSPIDTAIRTDMEAGAKRVRRTSVARQDTVDVSWVFTDAEMAAFRAWYEDAAWSLAGDSDSLAAWSLTEASRVAAVQLNPDDALADLLVESAATSAHRIDLDLATGLLPDSQVVFRATLKAAGRSRARLAFYDFAGAAHYANINLATGVITLSSDLVSANIQDRGNGWWRVTIVAATGAGVVTPNCRVHMLDGAEASTYAGDGVSGIAVCEIGARLLTGYDLHLRTDAAGLALGAAGGSAWVFLPTAVGGGFKHVEARFTGPFKAQAGAGLNWTVTASLEVRNA